MYHAQIVVRFMTLRNLETQLQEHRRHTEKCDPQRSAIAEHSVVQDHRINWDGARVLDVEQAWRPRKIKETLHIARQRCEWPLMNKDGGWSVAKICLDHLF